MPALMGDSVDVLLGQIVVAPDGCTLDAEGHLRVADGLNQRALRVAPGGAIVDEIEGPGGWASTLARWAGAPAGSC